ncbi:coatomer subunit beta [Trichonephila clavipes]|uniref:Coatomer subunit beta n=1 Tax=Trichonephila clavipes TaxID=2585209 RepID=A0A8X6VTX6_TRICX|nr:coatomer subunit beta [Trichonephila clavipes]
MLNSHPFVPLSSDLDDLNVLTPSQCLIGRSITSIGELDLTNVNENRLDNWQKITKIIQLIWKRWSVDYLNSLQQRNKWHLEKKNAKIEDMVIIKEYNLPSCQWSLGRINNIYPGKNSKVRVVEIKTTRVPKAGKKQLGKFSEVDNIFVNVIIDFWLYYKMSSIKEKMSAAEQVCYTLIAAPNDTEQPNEMQLKMDLEKGDTKTKIEALKKTIHLILNGEKFPTILMTIIRFVLPLQDHTIKKLLLIFWEIVPKTTTDGKLMQEMILVCDAYRKDLQHPNEFLRGSTLRFLCKLKEPELLEPLMPAIRACLEHRHSYVRRNAVLAIFTIFKNFEFLIPDAPELVANFLETEQDMSCKRNAFMMLIHVDQERALNYLSSCIDQVHTFGDILQLVIVELIYKVCHSNPSERSRFIRCIYNLLNSSSPSVRYEAAGTLVTLSSAPTAIKAAASCYIELIVKESDNNVKLIVLDRLIALKDTPAHERVLQDLVMDILRVLAASDLEVRRKTLNLALDLVSSRNVEEMVLVLRKEVTKTHNTVEHEDTGKYRQLLVRTLHSCCVKFPDVAPTIIPVLLEFLSDNNEQAAADVLAFVREAMQRFEQLRTLILTKLLEVFSSIKASKIHRSALWILGEYCETVEDIHSVMTEFRQCLGDIPIVDDEMKKASGEGKEENDSDSTMTAPVQKLVTADGTYATQSAFSSVPASSKNEKKPPLRGYLLEGDYFIGAALSSTLAKLALRYITLVYDPKKQNSFIAESMLIMTSIIHLGKSGLAAKAINDDDMERIALSLKAKEKHNIVVQTDDPLLSANCKQGGDASGTENMFELSLNQAIGALKKESAADLSSSKLSKVTQLTGFSDPVYAEAYVHVNQYDIVLDVLIVNQTSDTLQNCTLELATLGDLKLVEKPSPVILAPHDFCNIKASVKVASTENGIIFRNIGMYLHY